MVIKVVDENREPMSDSLVHVSAHDMFHRGEELSGYKTPDSSTDANGEAVITYTDPVPMKGITPFISMGYFPQVMEELRIAVAKEGYAATFISFDTMFVEDDEGLPTSCEIKMQKGRKLSGRVVDSEGRPVIGAKVEIDVEGDQVSFGPHPKPFYGPFALGSYAATTSREGYWEVNNAPSKESFAGDFKLKINHPWYAGDRQWSELQKEQGVTTQQLRDGTSVIKLNRGVRLTGVVTDVQGKALERGMVVWSKSPHQPYETKDVPIGPGGRYETDVLRPGSYRVTVAARGYSPQQHDIELVEDMQELNFNLQAGHVIKFRIVDTSGNLIPKASVAVGNWRGIQCLYEAFPRTTKPQGEWVSISSNSRMFVSGDGGNEGKSSILIHPNKDGLCVWDSAPEDEVVYSFSALRYRGDERSLAAGPDVKEIVLGSEPTIFGTVTDQVTGEPVKAFQVSSVDVPNGPNYMTEYAQGVDGQYRLVIERAWQKGTRYKVRIEAAGYRTAFGTKEISVGDEPIQEDFALEPANAIAAQVVAPDNKPVKNFELTMFNSNYPGGMHSSETSGVLDLLASVEPALIRIAAAEGYVEMAVNPNDEVSVIKLQPWASAYGRLMQDNQPVAGEPVLFKRIDQVGDVRITQQENIKAKTDEDGYFRFEHLPPVEGRITADLNFFEETRLTSVKSVPVKLESGKSVQVALGEGGATLRGRVVTSGRSNDASTKEWSLNYLIRRDDDSAPTGSSFSGPMDFTWLKKTGLLQWVLVTAASDFQKWMFRQQYYAIKMENDGVLQISGVEPGRYDLLIQLYDKPEEGLVETVGQRIVPVTVTADQVASGHIDLGDINIACQQGPRVGSDMREYQFTDSSGMSHGVCSESSQYQFVQIWASWNENCVEALPLMVSKIEEMPNDSISIICFNVDSKRGDAKALVDRFNVPWMQNYVGDSADLMQKLSITSLPANYLIGPDGKLIASSEFWSGIEASLSKLIIK